MECVSFEADCMLLVGKGRFQGILLHSMMPMRRISEVEGSGFTASSDFLAMPKAEDPKP